MCSYLIYVLASQEVLWAGLESQGPPASNVPIYRKFPQLTMQVRMKIYSCVNDAFLMEILKRLEGNPGLRISHEVFSLIMKFGSFFTQFDRFTYLRIGGFEKAPLKLPQFPSDFIVFLEVCRQMAMVNVKYLNMGKKGYAFPLSMSFFSYKTYSGAKGVEKKLDEFHF